MSTGAATLISLEGYLSSGDYASTVVLVGPDGMSASILTLGARLLDLRTASGRRLVLPLFTLDEVEADGSYIGVAVGRTANRIRDGKLWIPGCTNHALECNENGVNHIHGGKRSWDKRESLSA
jgi:aldose 1-epimerase